HMLKPNRDDAWLISDAARAFWDQLKGIPVNALRAVEGAVVRSLVDGESYQMLREAEADLRLANQDKMKEWGFFGDAVIGAVGTMPQIGLSLVPYLGVSLMALDASQRFEDQVAEQGGDVSGMDFFMAKYAFGAAYAAVEVAQTKLLTRKLAPGVARQAHLDMFHSIHAALKTAGIAAGNFAYETWEEGLQQGIENGFVAWGLDKDVTSEVVAGIVTGMKESAGTMALLSAGGVVGNRVRYRRGAFENSADALASLSRLKDLQFKIAGDPSGRAMKDFGAEYGYFAREWLNKGRKGLLDMGLTPVMADSMSRSFHDIWNAVKDDDVARRRFADGGRVLTMAEYASKAMPWLDVTTNDDGTLHFRRKADAPAGSPDVDIDLEVVPGGIKLDYADQNVVAGIVAAYNRGRPVEEQTTVERFNALGEAEKDAFVEANNIRTEGYYIATAPSGARVDSEQLEALEFVDEEGRSLGDAEEDGLTLEEIADRGYNVVRPSADGKSQRVTLMPAKKATRMSGRIVLSGKEAPSAQFHELFHAVSRFLVDSGQLDAGAVDGMRALFGDPRSDNEAFNEEVAAEAYREFLQGKVNMVEDGMLRKFADAVGQVLKLMRLVHDKRREDMAEWEQVFSDVQSGNFSGIPVAANSAAKKLAAARAADEARQKAREESDAKHKKPDAAPDATPDAAPASPAASDAGAGTGDVEDARKAAAARFGASAPVEQVRQPDKPVSSGEETVVTIKNARGEDVQIDVTKFTVWDEPETGVFSVMYPGGKGRLWGYYACIDVDDITTSSDDGYDKSLQDRLGRLDGDANSATQIDSISKNLQFQLLVSSPETSGGPPIIKFREAVVDGKKVSLPMAVTGNGRVLAYRKAVREGNADAFVEGMVSGAKRLRIPGVESQKHPMLVRVITSDIDDAKLVEAAQAANVSSVSNKTKYETALTDGRLINANDDILDLLSVGESYDFGSASNFAFLLEFSRLVGETGVFSTSASFSPEFHERAANAALGALVMRSMPIDEAREFISDVFKNSEAVGAKAAFDVLKAVSGRLVALDRNLPNYSISLDLAYALKDLMTLKRRRRIQREKNLHEMTVDEFLKEADFLRVRSGVTDSLLRELADRTSQQSILDLFSKYFSLANQYIDQVGPTPQLGLDFSGSGMYSIEMKPRWELLDEAIAATLSEKEAASRQKTRGDFVNYNARPVPPKPVVPAKSSATPTALPAKTPAKPARPDRDPLPRQSVGALEEIDRIRLRAEAMLEGVVRGYRMSQAEIEADPVLAAIKHRVETTVVDGVSGELGRKPQAVKNWFLERIPCFQGSKREMGPFVATAILRMNRAQRENFSKAVGWFSGTGTFEMSMAVLKLANGEYMLPNVKEIELHEYDA
ncbi:MAG: hypothetical protein GX635_09200, partial [Synergistaceae bacterium]|nr:hypothetical protein [Synergistaceae bacterium]